MDLTIRKVGVVTNEILKIRKARAFTCGDHTEMGLIRQITEEKS